MPKYHVEFTVEERFTETVEANTEDEAIEIATRAHEAEGVFIDVTDVTEQ